MLSAVFINVQGYNKKTSVVVTIKTSNHFLFPLGNVFVIFVFIKVSDVNDDVRRAAVESIGFILFR